MDYIVFFLSCNGVMTWFFSDDFTNIMTEGFKLESPYSDVAQSPVDSPMGIPKKNFRR